MGKGKERWGTFISSNVYAYEFLILCLCDRQNAIWIFLPRYIHLKKIDIYYYRFRGTYVRILCVRMIIRILDHLRYVDANTAYLCDHLRTVGSPLVPVESFSHSGHQCVQDGVAAFEAHHSGS